jgi:hypothetical protein
MKRIAGFPYSLMAPLLGFVKSEPAGVRPIGGVAQIDSTQRATKGAKINPLNRS